MHTITPEQLARLTQKHKEKILRGIYTQIGINPDFAKGQKMAKTMRQIGGRKRKKVKVKNRAGTPRKGKKKKKRRKVLPQKEPSGKGFLGRSPLGDILYGPSGVGKSSLLANWSRVGFIIDPQEEGIKDLVEFNQVPEPVFIIEVGTYAELMEVTADVAAGTYDVDTIVYDSLTGFEKICFIHHCHEFFDDDWSKKGFYNYSQGPKNAAKTDWPTWLDGLQAIRRLAGINVWLIAHSTIKTYSNPDGPDYDRYHVYLDKEIWSVTKRWARSIFFYNYGFEVTKEKGETKKKADTETEPSRLLYTQWSPAFDAKNHYGLDPIIDMGSDGEEAYKAFRKAYKAAGR